MILSCHVYIFDSTSMFGYNNIIPFLYSNVYRIQYLRKLPNFYGVILIILNKRQYKLQTGFYGKVCSHSCNNNEIRGKDTKVKKICGGKSKNH